jgi:hypothetical protein
MTEDKYSITTRIDRQIYDTGQQPLINERFDRDIKSVTATAESLRRHVQALKNAETQRFTSEAAEALFKKLFEADLMERAALARLVKLVYIPLGLLAVAQLLDALKGLHK